MTATHLYLSLIPQALIASMLEPSSFGRYYAVGTRVHSRGEAIFFEVDPGQHGGPGPARDALEGAGDRRQSEQGLAHGAGL